MIHFFDVDTGGSEPRYRGTENSLSGWGPDQVAGPAVVGLFAQVLDDERAVEGFTPGRLTIELLRPFRTAPTTMHTEVIRTGRRIVVCRADAVQGDHLVATATWVQYRRTENAPGERWRPDLTVLTPPALATPPAVVPGSEDATTWYHSDSAGWTTGVVDHANADRFTAWWNPPQVTVGRDPGPYARAMMVGEWTSLVTNVGTTWVGYINGDLTIALTRLPVGDWVGIQAMSHTDHDGIAVGTSTLADLSGVIGSGMVTAIANKHPDST